MKIRSAEFAASAPDLASCPPDGRLEFAFIGRSNVGKSSLINMLTGREGLARVSAEAGKTRLINMFTINGEWSLVDLPGYGYAKVGRETRGRFSAFVADYLQNRASLRGTFVLIDSRLSPQKVDLEFLQWMVGCGLPLVLVFTKVDKISAGACQANMEEFLKALRELSEDTPEVVTCSAKTGAGREEILRFIEGALSEEEPEAVDEEEDGEA